MRHLQVAGSGVSIHVAYPPDTDTPGFSTEKNTMVRCCTRLWREGTLCKTCRART